MNLGRRKRLKWLLCPTIAAGISMPKISWIHLFLVLYTAKILAGGAQSLAKGDYTNITAHSPQPDMSEELHDIDQVYFDLDSIIQAKLAIALSQDNEKEKLKQLFNLYEKSVPFLQTSNDYIKLFKVEECYILMDANENFLRHYYDKFIETNPSVQQLKDVAESVGKISTALRLKNYALSMVKNPDDFVLIIRGPTNATDAYRNALVWLTFYNLEVFKRFKPNFNQVLDLETWVINLKPSDPGIADSALFAIKRMFAPQFFHDERQCILDYGSSQLNEEHRKDVAWLKSTLAQVKD